MLISLPLLLLPPSRPPAPPPVPQNCTSLLEFLQEENSGSALVQPTCEPACAQSFASVSNHTLKPPPEAPPFSRDSTWPLGP